MKKYACIILLVLFLVPSVQADVGIGIKWNTEWKEVNEDSKDCITYGLYNPFDTDVMGYLQANKELSTLAEAEDPKAVPAGTNSTNSINTRMCFNIPKVYKEDCILPGMLCEKACEEPKKIYEGEIIASYQLLSTGGAVSSSTGSSFAVPLRIEVSCKPNARDFTPLYVVAAAMIGMVLIFILRKRGK